MFTVPETVLLSGVTRAQLAYWRKPHKDHDPVLTPSLRQGRLIFYSFDDVVALRMFAHLRQRVTLQKIRSALAWMREHYPQSHPSTHQLLAKGRDTVVYLTADGDYIDVVKYPGQAAFSIVMREIYGPFVLEDGREVPDLWEPNTGIRIDPAVRSGQPCLTGTRLPYDIIAGLTQDGLKDAQIIDLYPTATPEGVRGAAKFAERVAQAA